MINLKQLKNGKWSPTGPAMRYHSVIIEEDTPDKALELAKHFLDEFEAFLDHIYGLCDPGRCGYCAKDRTDNRRTRGLRTTKRPRRYDHVKP